MSAPTPKLRGGLQALILTGAVLGAWMIGSCKDAARAAGTSIFVSVNFAAPDIQLSQIRFSARTDHALFDPVVRPASDTGALLQSGQTLRILIPDSLAGETVMVGAEGLYAGRVVSEDQSGVRIRKDYEVSVDLSLPGTGAQPSCGACIGCCSGVACVTNYSLTNCGSGLLCTRCDPAVADNCSTGECRCGENRACSAAGGADRCVAGQCRCGSGEACQPGQFCIDGQCQCTLTSCPQGCCANNLCIPTADGGTAACGNASKACDSCNPGQTCTAGVCSDCPANCPSGCCSGETCFSPGLLNCGAGGRACVSCDPIASDGCNAQGLCGCGSGLACAPGQHCQNGTCTCDAVSCPNGCCNSNLCESPAANPDAGAAARLSRCGKDGRACIACDPVRSDTCTSSGICACGGAPSCEVGQKCSDGSCVCDPASCPGCCSADGLSCKPGNTETECGRGGFGCQTCPSDQSCVDGRCGNCNRTTCAGCCLGSTCIVGALGRCPTDGGFCVCGQDGVSCRSCATVSTDTCNADGTCGCGLNPPCAPGQHCISGACFCDGVSCAVGCCSTGNCIQPSVSQCGSGGGSCFPCRPDLANNCSSDGNCRCGSAPACIDRQQRCSSSGCLCDSISCPSGCCNASSLCLTPSLDNCGTLGASCISCDQIRANQCSNGSCVCGDGGICAPGQHCVNGSCRCDAISCGDGCCSGNFCTTPSVSACGIDGARCVNCGPRSDRCTGGVCRCGAFQPCPILQTCTPDGCQ